MDSPSVDPDNVTIGAAMRAWADRQGFVFREYEHWDALVRDIVLTDSGGDQYTFYATVDRPAISTADGVAVVGASLSKRGKVKHRALRRERQRYTFETVVPIARLASGLDEALDIVLKWVRDAGHELSRTLS